MNPRPIMDAGPGLNFLSVNKERLLFATVGPLSVPEAVETEILRKARQDRRFEPAERVWNKLPEHLMTVLCDDVTDQLSAAVHRISGVPLAQRARTGKDLGEIMVLAHAAVAAETGEHVTVLIDDGLGGQLATTEARRLQRLQISGQAVGSIHMIQTTTVLERAAGGEHLPTKESMRDLYGRLRNLDDGLPPLVNTNLMYLPCWQ